MKKILLTLAIIILPAGFFEASAQTYDGAFYEFFFGRQPGAKAEAMGKGMASVTGDAASYYYNPAGMGALQGLNLGAAFAGPYYSTGNYKFGNSKYNFYNASYNIKKYGTAGFSIDYFTYGLKQEYVITGENGEKTGTGTYDPDITNYRITLSSEVIKGLFAGVNLNYLHPDLFTDEFSVGNEKSGGNEDVFYFDLGVIKAFEIKSKKLNQRINLGSSLINVNSAEYTVTDASQGDKLPVIFRIGAAYDLTIEDRNIISKLNSYKFLVNLEYDDLFNSKYFGGFNSGIEFTFLEMLSLRAGYYTQDFARKYVIIDSVGNATGINYSQKTLSEFTYGAGINIPVNQLTKGKTPVELKLDYTYLKQPSYTDNQDSPGKYHNFTIIFNWIL